MKFKSESKDITQRYQYLFQTICLLTLNVLEITNARNPLKNICNFFL